MPATIKTDSEINAMRESGRMLATILEHLRSKGVPGARPKELSKLAQIELKRLGGEPAFLGFHGYPDVICISVNNQVQHSIPNDRALKAGDVVNYDFGVRYKGMITDGGITVCIGDELKPDTKRLIEGTKRALFAGLDKVKAGNRVGDVSAAIEGVLRKYRLGIVRELVGHGVGYQLHEEPEIPNWGHSGTGVILKAGMTVAIEPISTLGSSKIIEADDGWTILTADGSWSAQFEHTVLISDKGCEILTTI